MKKSKPSLLLFLCIIFIFNSGFLVIGHRGNPSKYPEETIQSDNSAFDDGADYVELDLHVSKDNVLVISHDRDLSRVVGSSVIVSQNYFSYLHSLKQQNGENIISLDELFQYYQNRPNTKFLIETKKTSHNNPKNMEQLLADCIKKYHMEDRVMIHSFSAASLKSMSELLPQVPRIFIVGSLKRINFEVLSYVNGINISSDLITKNPNLISQLHSLHQKVFVWAEMDESPKLWNWLINNDIDGVVTNFPATGYKYKLAKMGTKKYKVDKDGYYFGRSPAKVSENPYLEPKTNKEVNFLEKVHVSSAVIVNNKTFYEISSRQYVPAELVSLDLDPENILPYWSLNIVAKTTNVPTKAAPENGSVQLDVLKANTKYKILGINGAGATRWLLTKDGWVKANNVLYDGLENTNSVAFKQYKSLDSVNKATNIILPNTKFSTKSTNLKFWTSYIHSNAVIFNGRQL